MRDMVNNKKNAVYFFLFIFLWAPFDNSLYEYLVFFLFAIYVMLSSKGKLRLGSYYRMPLLLLLLWVYGVIIGILNGNEYQYIFRNFAGLVFYSCYFFLENKKIDLNCLRRFLIRMGIFTGIVTLAIYIDQFVVHLNYLGNIPFLNNYTQTVSVEFVIYFPSRELMGVLFSYCLYNLLYRKKELLFNIIGISLSLITIVICGKSSGDTLALMILAILIIMSRLQKNVKNKAIGYLIIGIGIILIIFGMIFENIMFMSNFFGKDVSGNAIRYGQIQYLLDPRNFKVFGHGLGAKLIGNIRSNEFPYSCEVIYLNLIHKFGIVAFFIFGIYIVNSIQSIKILFSKNENANNVFPISCLMYLITSLGNPMLFSSVTVTLHICCLLFLEEYERKNLRVRWRKKMIY